MATGLVYSKSIQTIYNKEWNLLSDAIYVALLSNAYTPDQHNDKYWTTLVANELANGSGYTTNGIALSSMTFTYTSGSKLWTFAAANVSWTSFTGTAYYAVVYDRTPSTDATRPLVAYQTFGGAFTATNGTFSINWNASGIFTITLS